MRKRLLLFFLSAGRRGILLMTGGVIAFSVGAFEHIVGHSLSALAWFVLCVILFMVGSFLAWNEQFNKAILAGNPELCIEYEKKRGAIYPPPPLIIKSLGGGNAYRLKLRDIPNGDAVAVFDEVSQLENRQVCHVTALIKKAGETHTVMQNLEAFLRTRTAKKGAGAMEQIEDMLAGGTVKVFLDYFNVSEMRFTAEFEIRYSYAWEEAYTVFVRRYLNPH